MIQHCTAHFVINKPWHKSNQTHDSVTEMLAYLKWPLLQNRRKIARLTLLFKIVKNLLNIPNHCMFTTSSFSFLHSCSTSTQTITITNKSRHIQIFFLPRTVIQWNCLQIPNIDSMDLENTSIV